MKITIENALINIEIIGKGKPFFFIHGLPDTSHIWVNLVNELKEDYTCYIIDLPGFGESQIPKDFKHSFSYYSSFIERVIDQLGITDKINLIVHDIGGFYGLSWAIENEEKIKRLFICNTGFTSQFKWHKLAKKYQKPIIGELITLFLPKKRMEVLMKKASPLLPISVIHDSYDKMNFKGKKLMMNYYRKTPESSFIGNDTKLELLSKKVPIIVLWGDRDIFIDKSIANTFYAKKIFNFPNHGHWFFVTAHKQIKIIINENIS